MANRFTWDERKAASNLRRHGVAFEIALMAFRDPFAVEQIDDRGDYGEERINMLGMCDGVILFVTYTERGEEIRLISARRAERHERDRYFRENSA
ncbi:MULTISPECIES: BrnT family toxin [Methylobacterium]|uniref:BrnT family toxin n=1 Tax=Methylobacterium TaxID=407 RepID=UPI00272ED992|nr:BrnT family toxin [Methylobacterium sp.]